MTRIEINHNQAGIDPGATVPDDLFEEVKYRLERAYALVLSQSYPGAEIVFFDSDDNNVVVSGTDDPEEAAAEVRDILERVYERGMHW